jgi:elongation factor Ts
MASVDDIKKLRDMTQAGVADCRQALDEFSGDFTKAAEALRKKSLEKASKKADREVKSGYVFSYVHHTGKVAAMVALACETDFVAKNDAFQKLGSELALHICASGPENIEELLAQAYVRDASKTIKQLIDGVIGTLGENIQVIDFKLVTI